MSPDEIARKAFDRSIASNAYPGRGLVIGQATAAEVWLQVYWIMGRSEHSRNRKFVVDAGELRTVPVDPTKVEDPSLIIYEAMLENHGRFLVSNGDQTRTLCDGLSEGKSFRQALSCREREHDAPNYTPRISGMLDLSEAKPGLALSIIKASKVDPACSDRFVFYPEPPKAGLGFGLTTYHGDGQPLPSFAGDPLLLPLLADAEETLDLYWKALDSQNRIALAVKQITLGGRESRILIRNRYA